MRRILGQQWQADKWLHVMDMRRERDGVLEAQSCLVDPRDCFWFSRPFDHVLLVDEPRQVPPLIPGWLFAKCRPHLDIDWGIDRVDRMARWIGSSGHYRKCPGSIGCASHYGVLLWVACQVIQNPIPLSGGAENIARSWIVKHVDFSRAVFLNWHDIKEAAIKKSI